MIGDLIAKIKDAEMRAAKIVTEAQNKAAAIESQTRAEMENIYSAAADEIARQTRTLKPTRMDSTPINVNEIEIIIEPEKIKQAKKYIIEEFNARYTK